MGLKVLPKILFSVSIFSSYSGKFKVIFRLCTLMNYVLFSGHEDSMSSENESVDLLNGETSKSGDEEKPSEATTSTSTAAQTECRCGAPTCRKIIF